MNKVYLFGALLIINAILSSLNHAAADEAKPLPSWQESERKQSIVSFVNKVTQKGTLDFVPVVDRIAVFDNDGTLWAEQPIYTQLMFAIERIYALAPENPEWQTKQPFAKLLKGDIKGALSHDKNAVNDIVMAANTGMSDGAYTEVVKQWISAAKHPTSQKLYSQMAYQPMIELINYLHENDFKVFIVSGGGTQFIRGFSQEVYGIPSERVIGSTMKRSYERLNGKNVIVRHPEMDFYNNHSQKVIAINTHIGKRPIAAFGNSDGDLPMLSYVTEGEGARLAMIVHHTDEKREWAYDKKSEIGHLSKGLKQAKANDWQIVDMKNDWKEVFVKAD